MANHTDPINARAALRPKPYRDNEGVRIALDATYGASAELTGIGVYTRELTSGLAARHADDRFLWCYRPKPFLRSGAVSRPNVSKRLLLPPLPVFGADVFHALNQRLDRHLSPRCVVTFHDLFVMTAEYSTREFRARFTEQAKRAVRHADLILAISRFTASQVNSLLKVESARIRVVPHGVRLPPEPPGDSERENLILFVGALQARKNVVRLIDAFEQIDPAWKLVLAGAPGGYRAGEVMERVQRSPARDRILITGHLPQPELESLYRRARVFAFPSLDEGFGLPVLEAMACGLPVITSRRSALPEVAGEGNALLVDPFRTDEIHDALRQLTQNAALRSALYVKGRARAASFSWDKTVESTYALYREIC